MTLSYVKKEIHKNIEKLNSMDHNLVFALEESADCCGVTAVSKVSPTTHFGTYCHLAVFEEYKKPNDAYEAVMDWTTALIAGTKLLDKNAYHNMY